MGTHTRRRPPATADVAKPAGVSHQAVSRVLDDHPDIHRETHTRVMRVVDPLGYRRNLAAHAPVTKLPRRLHASSLDTTPYGLIIVGGGPAVAGTGTSPTR